MKVTINGTAYDYVTNVKDNEQMRLSFFQLAKETFDLNFEPWYQKGYWGDRYITYALLSGNTVVSNVSVNVIDTTWQGQKRRYIGIGTVMTAAAYRQKGLNGWIMNEVLDEWTDKCDAIFLLANDSVVDFYPKFGFERADEYEYKMMNIQPSSTTVRKLDMDSAQDVDLLLDCYKYGNPFSALPIENNTELLMFYCTELLNNNIYYVDSYDAIVIAGQEDEQLICYDIFSKGNENIENIVSAVAEEHTKLAVLRFTPKQTEQCTIEPLHEEDTTLFVLSSKENPFASNKLMIPMLARA
ncbi:GNAT family N-acetyltransferase [Paenibacillus sp. SC116]|uniref:GNAT family N-acetyltransferase n=1 Tax=Paenibacillus sp. SC116 TaxID=2968986 RepID=UPI00215B5469|nr:GNAT family N-acetyltransferase [Paenibacillus sp. SC116]MCR8844499.1 GNAT family N-acetyltransferase [Paenibacillus sp. SC116]